MAWTTAFGAPAVFRQFPSCPPVVLTPVRPTSPSAAIWLLTERLLYVHYCSELGPEGGRRGTAGMTLPQGAWDPWVETACAQKGASR